MWLLTASILMLMLLFSSVSGLQADDASRPNVIVLLADDMGWQDASSFGSTAVETPHIDQLARDGMKWTQYYAASAVCSPTRASVLTGRYPLRFNIRKHFTSGTKGDYLPTEAITIAELLNQADYHTAHLGKWHLGGLLVTDPKDGRRKQNQPGPAQHGFDDYQTQIEQRPPRGKMIRNQTLYRKGGTCLIRNGQVVTESAPTYDKHFTDINGDTAVRLIKKYDSDDRPFFINLWWMVPHTPYEPAPEPHWSETAAEGISENQHRFRSMMSHMDAKIGKIVQTLKDRDIYDNTIIVFTSDNGAAYEGQIGPLKGGKTDLHEGGIRVPAIFTWPGHIPAGTTTDMIGHTNDILPTVCAAAGISLPEEKKVDGVNLMPHLTEQAPIDRGTVFWQMDLYKNLQRHYEKPRPYATSVARRGPWKLMARNDKPKALYNVEKDIGEKNNVMNQHPEIVEQLHSELKQFLNAPRQKRRK